jgi:hypothetical protein
MMLSQIPGAGGVYHTSTVDSEQSLGQPRMLVKLLQAHMSAQIAIRVW